MTNRKARFDDHSLETNEASHPRHYAYLRKAFAVLGKRCPSKLGIGLRRLVAPGFPFDLNSASSALIT